MKLVKQFFKQKETHLGIGAAMIFQLIFFTVWLTGYEGVDERTDQLKTAIVNEDNEVGESITETIRDQAPFQTVHYDHLAQSLDDMNQRQLDMVIHVPDDFTPSIKAGESAQPEYYINQAAPNLTKQTMQRAANEITEKANSYVYAQQNEQLVTKLPQLAAEESPVPEQAQSIAEMLVNEIQDQLHFNAVTMDVTKTNDTEGFSAALVPLLVVLASFAGAMLMSMQFQIVSDRLGSRFNKWSVFLMRNGVNLVASLIISVITVGMMLLFNVNINESHLIVWLFQSTLFFSFISLTQTFVVLFGLPGVIFNIIAVVLQLVGSGVLVPREMIAPFYATLSEYLPATYGAEGYFHFIFGGGDLSAYFYTLLVFIAVSLVVSLVRIAIPTRHKQRTMKGSAA